MALGRRVKQVLGQVKKVFKQPIYLLETPGPKVNDNIGKEQWADYGEWVSVHSSWCRAIRYLGDKQILLVQFRKGFIAQYPNVSASLAKQMFVANSMGKFVHSHLRDRPYSRWYG